MNMYLYNYICYSPGTSSYLTLPNLLSVTSPSFTTGTTTTQIIVELHADHGVISVNADEYLNNMNKTWIINAPVNKVNLII